MTVSCPADGYAYVTFTPETSGIYRFYSVVDADPVGQLENADGQLVGRSDDCRDRFHNHTDNYNFCVIEPLTAGSTYVLKVYLLNAGGEAMDVTIGVTCGHEYSTRFDEVQGVVTVTCSLCSHTIERKAAALRNGAEVTIPRNEDRYSYAVFTPSVTATYRFYGIDDYGSTCTVYDSGLKELINGSACDNDDHGHSNNYNFCFNIELEAGATYIFSTEFFGDNRVVGVACGHKYTIDFDAATGTLHHTCTLCGHQESKNYPVLKYGEEMTLPVGKSTPAYAVFVPETSGTYRFNSLVDYDTCGVLYDDNMEEYARNDDCYTNGHGHSRDRNFCFTAELEAGVPYILAAYTYDARDVSEITVQVGCAHEFEAELDTVAEGLIFTCTKCDFFYVEECKSIALLDSVSGEHSAEDNLVYYSFTPEKDGYYVVHTESDIGTSTYVYFSDMDYKTSDRTCSYPNHNHTGRCAITWFSAGSTYIIEVQSYYRGDSSFTITVTCEHNYVPAFPNADGTITYTCSTCDDSYTEECPVLEYNNEAVYLVTTSFDSYFLFTPPTSGGYRFNLECELGVYTTLYDLEGNFINKTWGDGYVAAELEAGTTYVLAAKMSEGSRDDVTIFVGCDHRFISEIIDKGTCAQPGTIVNTCGICGHQETDEYRVKHNYTVETIREAACEEDGLERYTCLDCGYSYEDTIYGSHDYHWTITPGSCTEIGMEVGICSLCGETQTYEGWYDHDYQYVTITEATCTAPGTRAYRCALCGEEDYIDQSDPLGHEYNEDMKCVRCNEDASPNWGDLNWTYADGVLTITGEGEMPELEYHGGWDEYWVDNTPWKNLPVREAVIGEGITNVTTSLFENRKELEKVTLPSTVTVIEDYAFNGCSNLTAVELPEALSALGSLAFASCDLRQVHIPSKTLDVHDEYGNFIAYGWFSGNRNLESITVDEGNPNMRSDEQGVLYSRDMSVLFFVPEGIEGTYTLPASVKTIECFLSNCGKLDTIEVEQGNSVYFSHNGMLYNNGCYSDYQDENDNTIYVHYENVLLFCPPARELGDYTIDAQTAALEEEAFHNCVNLTEMTIPVTCAVNYMDYIGVTFSRYFEGCVNLEAIWFEEGHREFFSDENGFVYNALPTYISLIGTYCEPGECLVYVPAAYPNAYLEIPEGIVGVSAMMETPNLKAIRFPSTLRGLGSYILRDSNVEWILFTGDKPEVSFMGDPWATGLHADVYYPGWMPEWMSYNELDEDSTYVNYIPYEQGKEPVWGQEEPEQPENPFTDVPAGAFYAAPVAWAVENNITSGATADSFDPNGQCLRAQVVTFLWRAEGCPKPTSTVNPFVDVKATDFYYDAVLWAVENNITSGSDATHFNPKGVCNRAQVVTFLHRAKGSPAPASMDLPFTDVASKAWYAAPVAWAVETGVTAGLTATTFGPNAACNRAQVVTFLYRAYNK